MSKIKLGAVSLFLISAVFILSGCGNKNQEQNQSQNQDQNKNQAQTQTTEQKKAGAEESKDDAKAGNPPAGMTEACSGKVEGDSCEVTMPSRNDTAEEAKKMSGSCKKAGQSDVLSCMPTNMPQGGPRRDATPAE